MRMLSDILFPSVKALWFLPIIFGKYLCNLFAKIFVTHLYIIVQQEIGLNSLIILGFGHFGTNVIKVELKAGIITLV